jgi:hypothetical protein
MVTETSPLKPFGVNGEDLDVLGQQESKVDREKKFMLGKSLDRHDSDLARKSAEASALTVFEKGKDGQNLSLQCEEGKVHTDNSMTNDVMNSVQIKNRTWLVKHEESVILELRTPQITLGIVEDVQGRETTSLFCIEPTEIPTEGVESAQTVSQAMSAPVKKREVSKSPK